jgi:hypothetical protein
MKRIIWIVIMLLLLLPFEAEAGQSWPAGDVPEDSVPTEALETDAVDDTKIDFGTGTNQISTADIPEQTNLYFTNARVNDAPSVVQNTYNSIYTALIAQLALGASAGGYDDGIILGYKNETGIDTGASSGQSYDSSSDYYEIEDGVKRAGDSYESGDDSDERVDESDGYKIAQSVTASASFTCFKVDIKISDSGEINDITVRIETDNSGKPSGTLVDANATEQVERVEGWTEFTFSSSFTWPTDKVWIVASAQNVVSDYFDWRSDQSSPTYAGGNISRYAAGSWTADATTDCVFRVYEANTSADLITNSITVSSAPTDAYIGFHANKGTGDVVMHISRDDGTSYSEVTESDKGTYSGSIKSYMGTVDISGQPSGTTLLFKQVIIGDAKVYSGGVIVR